jgi:hypothetical protein
MKFTTTVAKVAHKLSWVVAVTLLLLPFHAFITVWLSSLFGHYTLLRLWKEFLLLAVLAGALYILWSDRALLRKLFSSRLTQLIIAYSLLLLLLAFLPWSRDEVSAKAMWYGLLLDLRFLVFFLAVTAIASKSNWLTRRWKQLVFAPAVLVAAFAVLQYLVLPYDFLKHFGYGPSTILPYEAIGRTTEHLRVFSTLRGPNPLGAYLIIPICTLTVMFFRERTQKLNKSFIAAGFLLALIFSFSRSAWIGAALGVIVVAWLSLKNPRAKKITILTLLGLAILGTFATVALRNNTDFQAIFLHTDHSSKVVTSSSERHGAAAGQALNDMTRDPFGEGVGSAGPQSVYNHKPPRIAENYFLQIGQEAGIVGMILFIAICVSVGWKLFGRRADPLALALSASFIGITFVNLLSHAWTDDTLAYIWWGLAAVVLAPILAGRQKTHGKNHQAK